MATEYLLQFTAEDVERQLQSISENSAAIENLQNSLPYDKEAIIQQVLEDIPQYFHIKLWDKGGIIVSYPYKEGQTWKDFLLSTDVSDVFTWELLNYNWLNKNEVSDEYFVMATPKVNNHISYIRNPVDDDRFEKSSVRYNDVILPVTYSFYCKYGTHNYSSPTIIGELPTKDTDGYRYERCIYCGEMQKTAIPKLGEYGVYFALCNETGAITGCGVRSTENSIPEVDAPSPNSYRVTAPDGMEFDYWKGSDGEKYYVGDTIRLEVSKTIYPVFKWA